MFRFCILALLTFVMAVPAQAADTAAPYTFEDAFVRETPARITAGYVIIHNARAEADKLLRIKAPENDLWAGRFELHNVTKNAEGVLEMNPVDAIDMPADSTVLLRPGGWHVMIYDLARPIKAGETKQLVLVFEKGGPVTVDFAVQPITYTGIGSEAKTIPASDHHHHH